jgi:hypothetical protein
MFNPGFGRFDNELGKDPVCMTVFSFKFVIMPLDVL